MKMSRGEEGGGGPSSGSSLDDRSIVTFGGRRKSVIRARQPIGSLMTFELADLLQEGSNFFVR